MTSLVLFETKYRPVSHLITTMIVLRIVAALIVWIASSVAFLFVVIDRYSQVRERTRQFAISKMPGASSTVIFAFLFHEAMLISVPGTIIGIVLAYGGMGLFSSVLPDLFVMQVTDEWWLLAGMISAAGFLSARSFAAWIAAK